MEDTLRGSTQEQLQQKSSSLNPCFNGRYSQSAEARLTVGEELVLILVLMEDTLRVFYLNAKNRNNTS